ncbi:SPFH domain-containing protein [Kribbella sp. NPDC059898]|uniref:SPFH domain-containing protein n=1 Tax=Kribbella sp. NPDC059898 TaxID=3346995 RepID=UPI00365F1867
MLFTPTSILVALLVLAVVAALEPHAVPRDRVLVVLRSGRVDRVVTAGIALRLPLLESYVWLPKASTRHPLTLLARSREGVEVRIAAEVGIEIVDPAAAVEHTLHPLDLALDEIERALTRTIARCDVAALAELRSYLELAVDVPGMRVSAVDVGAVEIALTPYALRSVGGQTK